MSDYVTKDSPISEHLTKVLRVQIAKISRK